MANYVLFDDLFDLRQFASGERHIQLRSNKNLSKNTVIEASARHFEDLGQIIAANNVLKRHHIEATWFIPYFPYGRNTTEDHENSGSELDVALEWVNHHLEIIIADPHSSKTSRLPHFEQTDIVSLFEKRGLFENDPIVIVPDRGANSKIASWIGDRDYIVADKTRHPHTDALQQNIAIAKNLHGRHCLIVDDICDTGGTVLGLAKLLKKHNPGPMTLLATHGIFSRGLEVIEQVFSKIYTFRQQSGPTQISPAQTPKGAIPFVKLYNHGTLVIPTPNAQQILT